MEVFSQSAIPSFLLKSWSDHLHETFHFAGTYLKGIFWHAEKELLASLGCVNRQTGKISSIARNLFFAMSALPLALVGTCLTGIANRFSSKGYTYWEGKGAEMQPRKIKALHWNTCMFPGSLPCHFGGMPPAIDRLERLIQKIEEEIPDIFFLSEFSELFSSILFNRLNKSYPHFFVNIGPNAFGLEAAFCIGSRLPILGAQFIPSSVEREGEQKWMHRGYFLIDTPGLYFLYAHLHPKNTLRAQSIRRKQLKEIQAITRDTKNPWILFGDFNIDRASSEYHVLEKKSGWKDLLKEEYGVLPTCMNEGAEESIDYLLIQGALQVCELKATFSPELSDHAILGATLQLLA